MKNLREIKNLEHRRKEIENQVAAARLLQQIKSGSVGDGDQMDSSEENLCEAIPNLILMLVVA